MKREAGAVAARSRVPNMEQQYALPSAHSAFIFASRVWSAVATTSPAVLAIIPRVCTASRPSPCAPARLPYRTAPRYRGRPRTLQQQHIMASWDDAALISSPPSLGRSDESAVDVSSNPDTPADMSPYMGGDIYSLPVIDGLALPRAAEPPRMSLYSSLPDILDPNTGSRNPICHVCCIGAGYVGKMIAHI